MPLKCRNYSVPQKTCRALRQLQFQVRGESQIFHSLQRHARHKATLHFAVELLEGNQQYLQVSEEQERERSSFAQLEEHHDYARAKSKQIKRKT